MLEVIENYLKSKEVEYKRNVNLAHLSSARIGGISRIILYPKSVLDLISVLDFFENLKIVYIIMGRMTNTLFCGDNVNTPIICTSGLCSCKINACSFYCECGCSIPKAAKLAENYGLSGLEEISGIPGSFGAAIAGNAGAFGQSISDIVSWVTVYDKFSRTVRRFTREECNFGYRTSVFMNGRFVIIDCELSLKESDIGSIRFNSDKFRVLRRRTQPYDKPSLGSTFKRPEVGFAGEYIERCGLKGVKIGGAKISEKHAGFIINDGGATWSDYLQLANKAHECVNEKFRVNLEMEIKTVRDADLS